MKRTGFKPKPRKPLKRSGFKKRPKARKPAKKVAKRAKLPKLSTMRNKCDKLLTPIIKLMYPNCLLTGQPTQVAHHHVHKSTSTALRYYIPNLIPLTNAAHQALHHNESYWASKIIQLRGLEWFEDLESKKNQYVKVDVHFYIENYKRLKDIYDQLCEKST